MPYRLSYGNGQIEGPFATRNEADDVLIRQVEYSRRIGQAVGVLRVQFRDSDTGEWFNAPISARQRRALAVGRWGDEA